MSKYMIDSWMQEPEADNEGGEGDLGEMLDEEEDEKLEVIEKEEKVPYFQLQHLGTNFFVSHFNIEK